MVQEIKVYSTKTCPWCHKLKEFLKEHKIKFKDVDVSQDQDAAKYMVEKTGQYGVPVTEIDGEFVIGFDESKIKKLLKIR